MQCNPNLNRNFLEHRGDNNVCWRIKIVARCFEKSLKLRVRPHLCKRAPVRILTNSDNIPGLRAKTSHPLRCAVRHRLRCEVTVG
jgi:hypothetical protein